MFSVCPHCSAVFRVSAPVLSTAAGQARCGECHQSYPVIEHLYESLDEVHTAIAAQPAPQAPDAAAPVEQEVAEQAPETAGFMPAPVTPDEEPHEQGQEDTAVREEPPLRAQPLLAGWQHHGPGARDVFGVFMMLLLLGVLGLQWAWFHRERLAVDPSWRAGLEPLCEVLPCNLPLRSDLGQLALVARDVRRHPTVRSALLVNASFENQAGFTQPYPYLEVSFSDRTGAPVAIRRFSPVEYLGTGTDIASGLPAQGVARATLEILDPGEAAASFQFEFL